MSQLNLIQVSTVSSCNGNCIICPAPHSWMAKHPGRMSDADFKLVLRRIKEYDPGFNGQFCPYLMNEPTLDKKLVQRVEQIFDYFPNCWVEISTNAILLTPKLFEEIINVITEWDKTGRSHIWISHHAINKQTYETIMQRTEYAKTLNNIVEYIMINDGRIQTRLRGGGASRDGSIFYFSADEYQNYWQKIFTENELNPKNIKVEYFTFHNRAGNVKMKDWEFGNTFGRLIDEYHPFYCNRYISALHVLHTCEIVPCCMVYNRESVWGNLKEQSLDKIWKGIKRQDFIDKATGLKKSDNEFICRRCIAPGG